MHFSLTINTLKIIFLLNDWHDNFVETSSFLNVSFFFFFFAINIFFCLCIILYVSHWHGTQVQSQWEKQLLDTITLKRFDMVFAYVNRISKAARPRYNTQIFFFFSAFLFVFFFFLRSSAIVFSCQFFFSISLFFVFTLASGQLMDVDHYCGDANSTLSAVEKISADSCAQPSINPD